MTAPLIKGWCPGALRPMVSGDGLVVRVRSHGGRLSQDQGRALADLADRHGNGLIDLSARANLQLRGIREQDHAAVVAGLTALGLIDADAASEARRNIVVTPFWRAGDGTRDLARDLADALAASDLALPGKFGFAVDTGGAPVLRDASADIRIERAGDGFLVLADGAAQGQRVSANAVIPAVMDLAGWFLASGGATDGRGRMRAHLARGACPPDANERPAAPGAPQGPGMTPVGRMVALAFGQMDAATLARLADLAPLRLTPWRMVVLEGRDTAPDLPDLITNPADPLLRVVACTGAPACPQGLSPVRELARQLAPSVPSGRMLHVSGCGKGCAHPGPADITLVSRGGEFALGHGCHARDATDTTCTPAQLLADPALLIPPC